MVSELERMVEKRKQNMRRVRIESETKKKVQLKQRLQNKVTVITKSVCAQFGNITFDVVLNDVCFFFVERSSSVFGEFS